MKTLAAYADRDLILVTPGQDYAATAQKKAAADITAVRLTFAQWLKKGTKSYDLIAATPLILLCSLAAISSSTTLYPQMVLLVQHPTAVRGLMMLSQCATLAFAFMAASLLLLRRPAKGTAPGWMPRAAGVFGTYLTVGIAMLPSTDDAVLRLAVSTTLVFAGTAFACYGLACLGRSISMVAEARQLVTSGAYSLVRHPLYFGEAIATVGMVLQHLSSLALVLFALQLGFQFCRVMYEERVLAQIFPEYAAYRMRTAAFLPGIY